MPTLADPFDAAAAAHGDVALAVITGTEGPSYRPVGAGMAFLPGGGRVGTLSSGCIEADLALHADRALRSGRPVALRYGRGSPFLDIRLPCGGGLDILIVPRPDRDTLSRLADERAARRDGALVIDPATGAMAVVSPRPTGHADGLFHVRFRPELRFVVLGKGPEAATFAGLVQQSGYPNLLLSPDPETLADGARSGCATSSLPAPALPENAGIDGSTAVALFFHDHDWEPPILASAIASPALYIGAQGSRRARSERDMALGALGVGPEAIARIRGPVGLIPSARDPRTLAVSVLAEVLQTAGEAWR